MPFVFSYLPNSPSQSPASYPRMIYKRRLGTTQSDMRDYKQKTILLYLHTSKKFLIRMFVVFFDLTDPASKKANPVCITARKRRCPSHYYKLSQTGTHIKVQAIQLLWELLSTQINLGKTQRTNAKIFIFERVINLNLSYTGCLCLAVAKTEKSFYWLWFYAYLGFTFLGDQIRTYNQCGCAVFQTVLHFSSNIPFCERIRTLTA